MSIQKRLYCVDERRGFSVSVISIYPSDSHLDNKICSKILFDFLSFFGRIYPAWCISFPPFVAEARIILEKIILEKKGMK